MQHSVLPILVHPQGRARCEVDDYPPPGAGVEFRGKVTGWIELENAESAIWARGHLCATLIMACSRCLCDHEVRLQISVSEECCLVEMDEPADLEQIPILNEGAVDLSELVRQVLVLNLPPSSLCQADCKGLCPDCGRNLNQGPCDCPQDTVDERWAGLRGLLDE